MIEDTEFFESLDNISELEIKTIEALRKYEKVTESKNSKMRVPGRNFKFCLDIMSQPYNEPETKHQKKIFIGNPANAISRILAEHGKTTQPVRPIILVPENVITGNLNVDNAVQFLTEGKYIASDNSSKVKKKSAEMCLELLGERVTFEIFDDITSLKNKNQLSHVAAIFIKGDQHQFKDIKLVWGLSQIAKLFKNIRSYYLTYADVPIHPEVQKWNVKILKIDRFARHKDIIVQQEFIADFKSFLLTVD